MNPDETRLLEQVGISVETGLMYCQNDAEFYRTVLMEYARSASEKRVKLMEYLDGKDLKNYGILVHALKSTSKAIGAETFSEMALSLEKAANDGDGTKVFKEHEAFMNQFDRITDTIKLLYPLS